MSIQARLFLLVFVLVALIAAPVQAQTSPQDVVRAFLDAWNQADYERMYGLIHEESREAIAQQVFINRYQQVQNVLALTGVEFSIQRTQLQGDSAAVHYDVVLLSSRFDRIEDPDRIMRLLNTPNGWRVAWSTMDIFDALAGNAAIRPQSQQSRRGSIYDRNGQVLAADGQTSVALYTARQRMPNENQCAALLANITRQPVLRYERRMAENLPETLFFLAEMETSIYEANRDRLLSVCGVGQGNTDVATSRPHRMYFGGGAVAHVTGYIGPIPAESEAEYLARGYGSGDLVGLAGVERIYEEALAGRPESVLRIVEPGNTVLRELAGAPGTESAPVVLTIDRDLQLIVAQAMYDAYAYASGNWGAPGVSSGGAAVVLDVNTGAIRALVSYPMFEPTMFNPLSATPNPVRLATLQANSAALTNRATQEQFAPGSVFKIITGAAALNEGLVDPDDIFNCDLRWDGTSLGDTRESRPDWRVVDQMEPAGPVTPALALAASCNPFYYEYGARLYQRGPEKLAQYARMMGVGRSLGLDALPEVPGRISTPSSATAAINEAVGQGDVAIPPIQMAVAAAAVANGGTVYRPYLVQQIGGYDGVPVSFTAEPTVLETWNFRPGVIESLRDGMCNAVSHPTLGTAYGRFFRAGQFGYTDVDATFTACGKTGTAETARYPNAWFVVYAPAENPEIAIVVMVDQSREGSQIAAPIARRILDDYFGQTRASFPDWWNLEPYVPLVRPQ